MLKNLIEQEKDLKQQMADVDAKVKEIQEARRDIEKKSEELKVQANKIREKKHHILNLEKKIALKKTMIERLQTQSIDLVSEAKNKFQSIVEICKKRVALYADCQELAKRIMMFQREKVILSYNLNKYLNEVRMIEATIRSSSAQRMELQRELESQQNLLKDLKDSLKEALENAYKICGFHSEKDLTAEFRKKLDKLPGDIDEIDSQINQMEALAQCSYDIDKQIVDDFFKRQKLIEELEKRIGEKTKKLDDHRDNYENIRNEWNNEVEEMIKTINVKFSELFRMLRCLGEIGLNRPDNPEDFDKYGVGIRVSFRTEEKLQELSSWQQSGGEKSVSTMLYMIALQEMTKCPFRVVDEINQVRISPTFLLFSTECKRIYNP
jgi:chromosome segregation ATPase